MHSHNRQYEQRISKNLNKITIISLTSLRFVAPKDKIKKEFIWSSFNRWWTKNREYEHQTLEDDEPPISLSISVATTQYDFEFFPSSFFFPSLSFFFFFNLSRRLPIPLCPYQPL